MVTGCNTPVNIKNLLILPHKVHLRVLDDSIKNNSYYNSINRLVFVIEMQIVFYAVETELFNIV
jgi:hypothetical protein